MRDCRSCEGRECLCGNKYRDLSVYEAGALVSRVLAKRTDEDATAILAAAKAIRDIRMDPIKLTGGEGR